MKNTLTVFLSLFVFSSISMAKTIEVEVPAGDKIVEISSSVWRSGCSGTINFLNVIKTSSDSYVAGYDLGIKTDGEVWENRMPRLIDERPNYTCTAMVRNKTAIKFKHKSRNGKVISVVVPDMMPDDLDVEITDIQVAY